MVGDLESHGFKINPYDPCVANKKVYGNQLTTPWHVGDLKISQVDRKLVSSTILWLESVYGKMHGTRRKRHEYLGMWMEYSKKGEVNISMEGYLREVLEYFTEKITGRDETPVTTHLFEVWSGEKKIVLDEKQSGVFHRSVEQLLFVSTKCSKDIQTVVAFPTTCVRELNKDDWENCNAYCNT